MTTRLPVGSLAQTVRQWWHARTEESSAPCIGFEPLEPRVLLSADGLAAASVAALDITGTDGDDTVVLDVSVDDSFYIVVNGVATPIDAEDDSELSIDLGAGNDSLTIRFGYDRVVEGAEMHISGYGNFDLTDPEFSATYANAEQVVMVGNALSSAALIGSAADESFRGTSAFAALTDGTVYNRAQGFGFVEAHGFGGSDRSHHEGTGASENFRATPTHVIFRGGGRHHWLVGFETNSAIGGGGVDHATLIGSTLADTFVGRPEVASLRGGNYFHWAGDFRWVAAQNPFGGVETDAAVFTGTAGVEAFNGGMNLAGFSGDNFGRRAIGFDWVSVDGGGGPDWAQTTGMVGQDYFDAHHDHWTVRGSTSATSYFIRGTGFEFVSPVSIRTIHFDPLTIHDEELTYELKPIGKWLDSLNY